MLDKKYEPINQYKKSTLKSNILTYIEMIKQTVKNDKIINLFINKISQNCNYIQTHCNDRRNPFHFACRQWYSYNNPGIITRIHIQILV